MGSRVAIANTRFKTGELSSLSYGANSHRVDCGAHAEFYNNAFSYTGSIRLTTLGIAHTIIGWSTNSTPMFRVVNTNQINLTKQNVTSFATSTKTLVTNKWYFVAATYSALGVYTFYVSDYTDVPKVFGTGTSLQTWTFGAGNMYIGNSVGFNSAGRCLLKNIKIFNRDLSSDEVTRAYYENGNNSLSGCVSQYLFNEQSGSTAIDRISGFNGTITSATHSTTVQFPARTARY